MRAISFVAVCGLVVILAAVASAAPVNLTGTWQPKYWTVKISLQGGEPTAYPYATELTYCGSLRTYELLFASGADELQGSEWPILGAVAETLKQNAAMKVQVAGHTDNVGDAAKNQELSERRAGTVKKIVVEKYGADAARR